MLLHIAVAATLFLFHHAEAGGPTSTLVSPPKCPQCRGDDTIVCGQNVFNSGFNCLCGDNLSPGALTPCDVSCCESTPQECCSDNTSTGYTCTSSLCACGGGQDGISSCNVSPVTCCPAFIRENGRNLKENSDVSFTGTEEEYKEFVAACGEHDYHVSLHVGDTHFSGIATPANDDVDNSCLQFVVLHVVFDEERPATKELLGWYNKDAGKAHFPKESVLIGTFKAKDLALAFETAEPSNPGAYDLLTNNCANFLINVANELGVKVDTSITAYVTRRLLEDSGSALVDKIKESAKFLDYFTGRRLRADMRDEELVEIVVNARASNIAV